MKKLEVIYTLAEVLASAQEFPYDSFLFVDEGRDWNGKSKCSVIEIDKDDIDPEDEESADNPQFARDHGLVYGLTMADVQDIVINATQQDPDADESVLVKAFLHYHDRDAFIDLGGSDEP